MAQSLLAVPLNITMSKGFVQHEPCPNCGSKDNLGRYADGSAWCFGCHFKEPPTRAPAAFLRRKSEDVSDELPENPRKPDDCGTSFSPGAVEWLGKFHLDIPTAIRRGVVYSPSRDQIIYQLGNVWQARNLRVGGSDGNSKRKKSKNFTSGNVNECTHIYGIDSSSRNSGSSNAGEQAIEDLGQLVLVEDPVSSIRVAALSDSMPLLGSHLATSRLNALSRLYKRLVVWLDSDKLKEARAIAERARLIGMEVRVIYTELDPKCYTKEELDAILNAAT